MKRFWSKVDKSNGPNSCWIWLGARRNKYGSIRNGSVQYAHRVAWELTNARIPKGICVLHNCDNPLCMNPRHLFLGTYKDNRIDAVQKGRARFPNNKGSVHGMSKLSENEVLQIRSDQ